MSGNKEFLDAKWKAIEQTQYTDCSFLVGEKVFYGIKTDLCIASGYMAKLFARPSCPPYLIAINFMEPNIFKMINEFAHLGAVQEPLSGDDDAVELAIAADHLEMDSMKSVCIELISSTVTEENIWRFLEQLLVVKLFDMAVGCYQLLEEKTRECLSREEFLSASPIVMKEILKLDKLHISEDQLLEFCCNWARNQDSCYRDSMRDLLPHLRILTLSPEADDEVLPSFLTAEEQLHVLHFHMFGSLKINTPENLNTNRANRNKPTEYCETLIPDEEVSQDLEYLTDYDIYYWSMEKCPFLQNTVSLCSNTDLYLTSFECVGSFPKSKDCRLKFDETTDSFEVQPKYNAAPEDFWETCVRNNRPFYKNIDIVRSVKTKFGYQKILKCAQLLPKGVEVNLQVTLTNNEKGSERCCRFIRNGTVKQPLNSGLATDFDYLEVESFNGKQNSNTPYFLKNIRYVKKCDI